MTRLLTTREVADRLGLSPATILRRWRAGELPGFRIAANCLRFDEAEITEWLHARRRDDYLQTTAPNAPSGRQGAGTNRKEDADSPTGR